MTEPMNPDEIEMIEEHRESLPTVGDNLVRTSPRLLARLFDIAEDHARLAAERDGAISRQNQLLLSCQKAEARCDALRAEHARICAHIESSHNEVTCSQDARHANEGGDRVPMLTCMTWEAHTLRAEVASLRESEQRIIDGVTETCEAHRLHQTQMRERAEADLTAARERIEKLEAALQGVIRVADRKTVEFDAARAALAATEEESAK